MLNLNAYDTSQLKCLIAEAWVLSPGNKSDLASQTEAVIGLPIIAEVIREDKTARESFGKKTTGAETEHLETETLKRTRGRHKQGD